jgi:haloalkane dehalogenase
MNKTSMADFPFESHSVEVFGSHMHCIDGEEGVSLEKHNPRRRTFSRAVAVDLIGMGRSDKPDIDHRFVDHVSYLRVNIIFSIFSGSLLLTS